MGFRNSLISDGKHKSPNVSDAIIYLAVIGYIAVWCGIGAALRHFIQRVCLLPRYRADTVTLVVCFAGASLGLCVPLLIHLANSPFCCFRY